MRRFRLFVACVSVLALASCTASTVDRDARVQVHGTLARSDSSAAADVPVALVRRPDLLEVFGGGLLTVASLGLACLAHAVHVCDGARTTITDRHGRYHYTMTGNDVRGAVGEASDFDLSAQLPAGHGARRGPAVTTSFQVQRTDLALPGLTFWQPAELAASPAGDGLRLEWSRFAVPHVARPSGYTAHFTAGNTDVWTQRAHSGDRVDPRALEDTDPAFWVEAQVTSDGPDTTFRTSYDTRQLTAPHHDLVPESRDAACSVAGADGPVRLDTCPLTNGAFDDSFPSQSCAASPAPSPGTSAAPKCPANTSVVLDLGAPRPVGAVFAHGLSAGAGGVVLETSDDADHWTRRAALADPAASARLSAGSGVTARYVRLRAADAGTVAALTELSVWPTP